MTNFYPLSPLAPQIPKYYITNNVFFLVTGPGRTVALILTLNGSNDVFPPKDGPFGSLVDE